ncbi:site-specific integrase [Deinococcus soli (ex Cha et al. 2016)]|uniref:Integrase/recombinase XerC n=2 Tax=Deinococcus soli (ex Cha et al. 2016) TaxID=1309411 RepID=A0ACC6KGM7_9DEIO|nr:site-specific integrase [Deinococcus soli (ex Cha et al. 2016)]MDR6219016.1 integrase/recombinase XerC [Deinococcus soli (ex Cha et al. 2016)]MDR6328813.1 integrase/recombinase XerC [Deinococcus soli (ex Cha et al. 2016)]MDR6751700.1 integrase/recombinase XerC [Deinococcus soli (ex Cha et al. 2016)]
MTLVAYAGNLNNRANVWVSLLAEERRRRAVRAVAEQDHAAVWELVEAFMAFRSQSGVLTSVHTLRSYRTGVRQFLEYAAEHAVNVLRPGRDDAQRYINALVAGGKKVLTVRSRVAAAVTLYKALRWAEATEANPFEETFAPQDRMHALEKVPPYQERVVRRVLAAAQERIAQAQPDELDRATAVHTLLVVLAHGGLRIDEALNLEWKDIRLEDDELRLVVRSGKGRKSREVPLSRSAVEALRAYRALPRTRKHPPRKVFPFASRSSAMYHVRPLFDEHGVTDWRGFHALRKYMGSRLYENLEDFAAVAEVLGHANVNTTKAYVRVGNERARKVLRDW